MAKDPESAPASELLYREVRMRNVRTGIIGIVLGGVLAVAAGFMFFETRLRTPLYIGAFGLALVIGGVFSRPKR